MNKSKQYNDNKARIEMGEWYKEKLLKDGSLKD